MGQGAEDAENAVVETIGEEEDIDDLINHLEIILSDLERTKAYNRTQCKIGDKINCPNCRKSFKKKSYQQVFCSGPKAGRKNCKDVYWNRVKGLNKKIKDLESMIH